MYFKIIMTTSVTTMFHNTTPDLQDQDQDRFFWSQTGLVLRPTVSDTSLPLSSLNKLCTRIPYFKWLWANPGLPGKRLLIPCVCMCMCRLIALTSLLSRLLSAFMHYKLSFGLCKIARTCPSLIISRSL